MINLSGRGDNIIQGSGLLEDLTKQASGKIGKEAIKIAKKVEKAIESNPLVKEGIKRLPADKLREVVLLKRCLFRGLAIMLLAGVIGFFACGTGGIAGKYIGSLSTN